MWAKNPIPRAPWQWDQTGASFEPVCEESETCKLSTRASPPGVCRCSGTVHHGAQLLPNLEIVDVLKIPSDLTPGRYVLGWRWDSEETDQVWASCSDVTITAASSGLVV